MTKLTITGSYKYLSWLQNHIAHEHRKTKGKTTIRR